MKHLPNAITLLRIVLSVVLLFLDPAEFWFTVTYLICGISDMADGFLARKFHLETPFGARLDSVADLIFVAVVLFRLLPLLDIPKPLLIWIILIAGIRFASLFVAKLKFHTYAMLHTYLNKITGVFLFLFPLLYRHMDRIALAVAVCIISSFAAIEELVIHLRAKELCLSRKSLWRNR